MILAITLTKRSVDVCGGHLVKSANFFYKTVSWFPLQRLWSFSTTLTAEEPRDVSVRDWVLQHSRRAKYNEVQQNSAQVSTVFSAGETRNLSRQNRMLSQARQMKEKWIFPIPSWFKISTYLFLPRWLNLDEVPFWNRVDLDAPRTGIRA